MIPRSPKINDRQLKALKKTNLGRSLEEVVLASQLHTVRLAKTTAGVKMLRGGAFKRTFGIVDFVGTVVGSGRAIHFDAKQTAEDRGFYLSMLKPHQEEHIAVHWRAGAIAGALVEATAADVKAFFWVSARMINDARRINKKCILWTEAYRLGDSLNTIDFGRLIAFAEKEPSWQLPA